MDIDEAYRHVGEFGSYQQKIFWSFSFGHGVLALHQIHNVFLGATPKFYCKRGKESFLGCPSDGVSCDKYVFTGEDFTSVTSEWNLVCENAYKSDAIQSCVMLGILLGSLIFGYLGDKYGRRKIVYMACFGIGLTTVLGVFSPNYYVYAASRLLVGIFCGGMGMVGFVLVTEVVGPSKRSLGGMVMPLCFATGIATFAAMAYCIREWKMLSIATVAPTLVAIYYYLVFPESPRWLYSQGFVEEAERLLELIGYRNTGHMPKTPIILRRQEGQSRNTGIPQPGFLDIVRHPVMRSRTLNNSFTWFVNCCVYYGLTMSSGNLGGNFYLSVALSGMVEIPSCLLAFCLMEKLGRRLTYSVSMLAGGLFCIVLMFIPPDDVNTRMVLAILGKMGITISFCVAWLYAAEMYPTNIRNKAMSVTNMMARIGGIVAPMVVAFGKIHTNMDFVIFGSITIIAGFVCLKLPETLGRSMPETLEDLDNDTISSRHSKQRVLESLPMERSISVEKLQLIQEELDDI